MRLKIFLLLLSISMSAVAITSDSEADKLQSISSDFWQDWTEVDPFLAISSGYKGFEAKMPNPSKAYRTRTVEKLNSYLTKLKKIDQNQLSDSDALNYKTLQWIIDNEIGRLSSPISYLSFNTVYSWLDLYNASANTIAWREKEMSDLYPQHLVSLIDYISNQKLLLTESVESGYTQQCETTTRFIRSLDSKLSGSAFAKSLISRIDRNDEVLVKKVSDLAHKAEDGLREYKTYLETNYYPSCRKEYGLLAWKNGSEYYSKAVRYYTSTDKSPSEVHNIGLKDVDVLRAKVEELRTSEEVQRIIETESLEELFEEMRTNPIFYASSGKEILDHAKSVMASVTSNIDDYFTYSDSFPDFTITSIPDSIAKDSADAFYYSGSQSGTLFFNTHKAETRKSFALASTAIHEGIPGHHYQIFTTKMNQSLPEYRSKYYFHASGEGYALYTETLIDKLYPEVSVMDKLGALSMELLRAGRLVVDTGIHHKGWSRQKAIDFLLVNTGLGYHEIESEVVRFISLPGQATSYKIGQLEILDAKSHITQSLGENFDEKAFHNALVHNTSLPILILKEEMLNWASDELAKNSL